MIDFQSWRTALAEVTTHQPEGFTVRELMAHFNKGEDAVREMLRKLKDEGMLDHVGYKQVPRIDGRPTRVPVYQIRRKD